MLSTQMMATVTIPRGSRVFLLEDSSERIQWFRKKLEACSLQISFTAEDGIAMLAGQKFDFVFLDHDLSLLDYEGRPLNGVGSGEVVARSMCDSGYLGENVLIHSWNPTGAANMAKALKLATICQFGNFDIKVV